MDGDGEDLHRPEGMAVDLDAPHDRLVLARDHELAQVLVDLVRRLLKQRRIAAIGAHRRQDRIEVFPARRGHGGGMGNAPSFLNETCWGVG